MTDLRSRLSRLGYREDSGREAGLHRVDPSPRPSLEGRGGYPIQQVIPGSYLPTPHGECFVVEHHHPPGHPHGSWRLDEALDVDPRVFTWLGRDPALASFDLARSVFLDVETTGLAGGTGTYAFLVGIGYFEGSRFVVRQFFMDDPDGEEAMLHLLAGALEPFSGMVTFNGKAFDVPLLETRFLMARLSSPLQRALHLDLLFPSRRLWRERLESCALPSLESAVLGVERDVDVPGWAIPGIYFNYLRGRDARPLAAVFEHNRQDLLSLATLVARLGRQFQDPFHPSVEDGRDLCSLGSVFESLGLADRAALCYERALALDLPRDLYGRAMVRLGNLYKRMRLREDAVALWRRLAEAGYGYTLVACVELAKHFEHAAREYREAERLTLQALAALELRAARAAAASQVEQERRELEHRLARLRRKMATRSATRVQ